MTKKIAREAIRRLPNMVLLATLLGSTALFSGQAGAQEWLGTVDNNWGNAANWNGGVVPGVAGNVVVNPGNVGAYNLYLSGAGNTPTVNSVVVRSGTELLPGFMVAGGAALTVSNTFEVGVGASPGNTRGAMVVVNAGTQLNLVNGGLFWIGRSLVAGASAEGVLFVGSGAQVTASGAAIVGQGVGAVGSLIVDGAVFASTGGLILGANDGEGNLIIRNGGEVSFRTVNIGGNGSGNVSVDGAGSRLLVTNPSATDVYLDRRAVVAISNDAMFEVAMGPAWLAGELTFSSGAQGRFGGELLVNGDSVSGGVLRADGALTGFVVDGSFTIGLGWQGSVYIENGADVSSNGPLRIGREAGGSGFLRVSDALLSVNNNLFLGGFGVGRVDVVSNGHINNTGQVIINSLAAQGYAIATVAGAGSSWVIGDGLGVGWSSNGSGALEILDGGTVSVASNFFGIGASAQGRVLVSGGSSHLNVAAGSSFNLGGGIGTGRLTIANGGLVTYAGGFGSVSLNRGSIHIGGGLDPQTGLITAPTAAGTLHADNINFVGSDGSLVFNHTNTAYDFNVALFGNGALRHLAGTTRLTRDSSLFTGNTLISGGTLIVDNTLGSSVTVASGGTLTGSDEIGGNVSVASGGTLAGTYGDTLTINGNLNLNANSIIEVHLGASGGMQPMFDVGGNLTLDGVLNIVDAGGFGLGPGTYRLFDYAGTLNDLGLVIGSVPDHVDPSHISILFPVGGGAVDIYAGVPQAFSFWDGSIAGLWNNNIINGGAGTWRTNTNSFTTADGSQNGQLYPGFVIFQGTAGIVEVDNAPGQVQVTGMQFGVSGYRIQGGPIQLTASEAIIRVGDSTLASANYTAVIASNLVGNATLVKRDYGILELQGINDYTGGTRIEGGTLIGNANSVRGNVAISNGAALELFQGGDATFAGRITGGGTATKSGPGNLTLGNLSDVNWTVTGTGSLIVDAEQFFGSVAIGGNATMTFDQSGTNNYAGIISGVAGARLEFDGGYTRLMANNSAYLGETHVLSGTLEVNNGLGGNISVNADGTLVGSNTIGGAGYAVTVEGGLRANGANAVLTIAGNLEMRSGSRFSVNATAQSAGSVVVDGTATLLDGSVLVVGSGSGFATTTQYTILTAAGGITGTFGSITSTLAFLTPSLNYIGNDVILTLERNSADFASIGITPNQIATGAGVESLGAGNAVHDAVLNLSDAEARDAFDQLSGEIHGSIKGGLIAESSVLRDAAVNRIRAAFGDASSGPVPILAYGPGGPEIAMPDAELGVLWGHGFGSWGHADSDGNAAAFSRGAGGLLVGGDAFIQDWRVGLMAGYGRSGFASPDRESHGSADSYHLGLYGGTEWGNVAFRSGLAYTGHGIDTTRNVAFPGFDETLSAAYTSGTVQAFGEFGYRFDLDADTVFEPFVNLAHVSHITGAFTETGGSAALSAAAQTINTTFATLGLRASHSMTLGSVDVTARGMLGWRHAFGDAPTATHAIVGGDAFTVSGAPIARDAALVEAGLDLNLTPAATLGFTYSGQFAAGTTDQAIKANLSVKF